VFFNELAAAFGNAEPPLAFAGAEALLVADQL